MGYLIAACSCVWRFFCVYLSRKLESKTHALALGAAGYWDHRRQLFALCPGAQPRDWNAAAGDYCPVCVPFHPRGWFQYPGFPPQGGMLFSLAATVL